MASNETPSVVHLKSSQLRVLAHPLRSRLLTALRLWGPNTATGLAQKLETNTGATSYHLRKLASVGLVEDDASLGVGRERWWTAAHDMTSWTETDFSDDPDDVAAADWLFRHYVQAKFEWVDRWVTTRGEWSNEWRDAANSSDYQLHLSPMQLADLNQEIHEVIMKYDTTGESSSDDLERVAVIVEAFPHTGGLI
jgi:DNA-binding transcriptional ArsR family regulator